MATYFVKSGSGSPNSGTYRGYWANSTTWAVGDRVYPTMTYATAAARGYCYECTTGGAGGSSEPTWVYTTPGTSTTSSGSAVFTCRNPDTWTDACIDLNGGAARSDAGDTVYVASTHSMSYAGEYNVIFPASTTQYVKVYCVVESGANGTSGLATTAVEAATGSSGSINIYRNCYVYGLQFQSGAGGANDTTIRLGYAANAVHVFENCVFSLKTTAANRFVRPVSSAGVFVKLKNCTFDFANAAQCIFTASSGILFIEGGSFTGTAVSRGIVNTSQGACGFVSNVDFSACATTVSLTGSSNGGILQFRNCKMPSGWTQGLHPGTNADLTMIDAGMYNCDSGDTNYRVQKRTYAANLVQDTGIYNDAGSTDGSTRLSWKISSTAGCDWHRRFETPEIVRWNETTGTAITATVEIVHDGASAATDEDVWLEVMYLGTSGTPLGSWISDAKADILASATAQTTSSATWTGATGTGPNGSSTWNTLKLACTFTPQEKGFLHARVVVAKASWTVYVDPLVTVT